MKKQNDKMWGISLIVIGIVTLILVGSNMVGAELSDLATRILGVIDLITLPFLAYSSVKKMKG